MMCKMLKKVLIVAICCAWVAFAGAGQDYISAGKTYLFEGTPAGFQNAYDNFEAAMQDPAYPNDRELLFLHSLARAALVFVGDNGGQIDSFRELAGEFDVEFDDDTLDISYPTNHRDRYEVPETAPDEEQLRGMLDDIAAEIRQIIDALDLIESPEQDRFFTYFAPEQTGFEQSLRLGYGEVLLLKGTLALLEAQLTATDAYDMTVENIDEIIENYYAGMFSANRDILDANPDFLKLLPTANDPAIGKDVLAQSAADVIDGIGYILDAIEYIKTESDCCPPQQGVERFLYFEEEDYEVADMISENLTKLRDSMANDTVEGYIAESSKIYELRSDGLQPTSTDGYENVIGQMDLIHNFLGEAVGGTVLIYQEFETIAWDITDIYEGFEGDDSIGFNLERYDNGMWEGAYMEALFSSDKSEIINATIFPQISSPTFGIYGILVETTEDSVNFDPNPIYGSTARYPDPISPRDMLPEFNKWNMPQPGTVGAGAGYDATLGGVLPDMTQKDWQILGNLQPTGLFYIPELYKFQYGSSGGEGTHEHGGMIGFWYDEQIVFEDISGDLLGEQTGNLDIATLYMGYHIYDLYAEIIFNDTVAWNDGIIGYMGEGRAYEMILSYHPDNEESSGALRVVITFQYGYPEMRIYQWQSGYVYQPPFPPFFYGYGYGYWEESYHLWGQVIPTERGLQFSIDTWGLPFLPGRFLTLNSYSIINDWWWQDADLNSTHLQIAPLGTASGTVAFEDLDKQAVFVEAYTDANNPADTVVSTARVNEDGSFTLEGIGLAWKGYVRAFTPLFGFDNPFELGCIELQDKAALSQWKPNIEGLSFDINKPRQLVAEQSVYGEIACEQYSQHLFSFNANNGHFYYFMLEGEFYGELEFILYGRDGSRELIVSNYLYEPIEWQCPEDGEYFVELLDSSYECWESKFYTLTMSSQAPFYDADMASPQGIGFQDGIVDIYDLQALGAYWLQSFETVDINKDGIIDYEDFVILASQWMQSNPR